MAFQERTFWRSRLVTTLLTTLLWSSNAHSETLVDSALRFFVGNDSNTTGFDLDRSRPQPVPPASRDGVLKSLPTNGRVTKLKQPQKEKLESLGLVLQLHQRQSIYDVM